MAQWIRYSMLFPLKHDKFNSPHWSRGQRNPQGIIEHVRRLGSCWCGSGVTLWTPTLMKQTKHSYRLNNWSLFEKLQRYGDLKIIPIWKAKVPEGKSQKKKTFASMESHFSWQANGIPKVDIHALERSRWIILVVLWFTSEGCSAHCWCHAGAQYSWCCMPGFWCNVGSF